MDEGVLAAYRSAASSADAAERAEAMAGLGAEALRRGELAEAARQLTEASRAAPRYLRAAFLLARTRYELRDPQASQDFSRVLTLDPANAAARLYLADVLADAGRFEEAGKLYLWYFSPEQTPDAWIYQDRAKQAILALREGRGTVAPDLSNPERCLAVAEAYTRRGSYERASRAVESIRKFRPWRAFEAEKAAEIAFLSRRYGATERLSREALALGAGAGTNVLLANAILMRGDAEQARRVLAPLMSSLRENRQLAEFYAALSRL